MSSLVNKVAQLTVEIDNLLAGKDFKEAAHLIRMSVMLNGILDNQPFPKHIEASMKAQAADLEAQALKLLEGIA